MRTVTNTHLKFAHNISVEEYKKTYNHKVVKIESAGVQDVYNITVEGMHNYAVGAGVIIKNCYHKDPTMMKYINDPTTDMHRDTAMDCFLVDDPTMIVKAIRHTAKNMFVFPQFYGDWYKSCAESMWIAAQSQTHVLSNGTHLMQHLARKGIKTYDKFEKNIKRVEDLFWTERFPVYTEWKESWWTDYCSRGYIDMYTGFRCHGVLGRNDCINYPVQGAAFHCLLLSFILLDRIQFERKWKTRLIAQIHDEVILDVHPSEEKEVLETVDWVMTKEVPRIFSWINVPLVAEAEITGIDGSWCDKKAA